MRLKLSIKFHIAFLTTSLTIVIVMIAAMQFYVNRSFSDYIGQVEAARLGELGPILSREYQKSNGWQRLQDDPERWHELVRPRDSAAYSEKPPIMPSGFEFYIKPPPPPQAERAYRPDRRDDHLENDDSPDDPERWHELVRPRDSAAYSEKPPIMPPGFEFYIKPPPPPRAERAYRPDMRDDNFENDELPGDPAKKPPPRRRDRDRKPPPNDRDSDERPPRNERDSSTERPVFSIEHRLALFDAKKNPIVGRAESTEGHTLLEITVLGKTVGWLGLRNQQQLSNPLDMAFLKQQARAFYVIGACTLILAAVVAYLLSRHLLSPVQQLIQGTRNLASRKFDVRIDVHTTDELGQLAVDFNQMAHTLEQYEHLRQQWISDIAHELRTPLSILRGEIEAMMDGIRETNPQQIESLHEEVIRLSRLVANLHDLSIAESAALHIRREPMDLVRHIRACLRKFQTAFAEREIRLVDDLGDSESIWIAGDADRLTQVFSNMMANTLRYTDVPGCLIVRMSRAGNAATVQFADTPPGVPTESLDRLFDRLYRVDPSRSRAHGGSGLGLSICKTIVEAHDGKISARHAAAGGLQIDITFPLIKEPHRHHDTAPYPHRRG